MKIFRLLPFIFLFLLMPVRESHVQLITQIDTWRIQLVYFGGRYTYMTPHMLRTFFNAMDFHQELWDF